MRPIWKTLATLLAVPLALVACYLAAFAVLGRHYDVAVVALALVVGLLTPGLYALWAEAGARAAGLGMLAGLAVAAIGSALGIALGITELIAAGGFASMAVGLRLVRRRLTLTT